MHSKPKKKKQENGHQIFIPVIIAMYRVSHGNGKARKCSRLPEYLALKLAPKTYLSRPSRLILFQAFILCHETSPQRSRAPHHHTHDASPLAIDSIPRGRPLVRLLLLRALVPVIRSARPSAKVPRVGIRRLCTRGHARADLVVLRLRRRLRRHGLGHVLPGQGTTQSVGVGRVRGKVVV